MLLSRGNYSVVLKSIMDDPEGMQALQKALSTYPMYVPKNEQTYTIIPSRDELNMKILNHYKYREIGFETPGQFIDRLKIAMEEIMPYYYSLYKSADIMNGIEDPFGNVDIVETFTEDITGNSSTESSNSTSSRGTREDTNTTTTSSTGQTNSKNITSDTPQSELSITAKNIDDVSYASEATWNETNNEDSSSSNIQMNGTDENEASSQGTSVGQSSSNTTNTRTKKGNQGVNTYAHDMKELREVFLNIERQIINDQEIQELFCMVYR